MKKLIHIFVFLFLFTFFLLLYPIAIFLFGKKYWIVCERHNDARDNGYFFFKYLNENHPKINSIYLIDKNGKYILDQIHATVLNTSLAASPSPTVFLA